MRSTSPAFSPSSNPRHARALRTLLVVGSIAMTGCTTIIRNECSPTPDAGAQDGGDDASVDPCPLVVTEGAVGTSAGVLTNHPELAISPTDAGFTAVSLNLSVRKDPNAASSFVIAYGELKNTSGQVRCYVNVGLHIGGYGANAVVHGTLFVDNGAGTQAGTPCVLANQIAPFDVILDQVPANLLASSPTVSFSVTHFTQPAGSYVPDPAAPTAFAFTRSTADTCGKLVNVGLTTSNVPIHNVALTLYARDARGLLVHSETAFHLGGIPASTSTNFATLLGLAPSTSLVFAADYLPN